MTLGRGVKPVSQGIEERRIEADSEFAEGESVVVSIHHRRTVVPRSCEDHCHPIFILYTCCCRPTILCVCSPGEKSLDGKFPSPGMLLRKKKLGYHRETI